MNYLNGGYAMIKHNSTQEELQIAYRSKKPVLCYDENRRAHWAVIEETATESVDEETQEPITIYEYSYRLIDEASGGATLDDIVDSQGNKRFVEGNGVTNTISGVTFSYCKWSLSGTHIMFVCAGTIVNTVSAQTFCTFTIPQWIHDKIVAVGRYGYIELKETTAYGVSSSVSSPVNFMITKLSNQPNIVIKLNDAFSRSDTLGFRIQFDLLIDSEYSE